MNATGAAEMTESNNAIIRVGLVGFGTASSVFHAPLIQSTKRFAITHVLERSTTKSAVLQPCPTIVRSMDDLLKAPIDLVVIATPTNVHFEQAKQAILARKHVVVDKPLCVHAAQAQELVALAKEHGVLLTVFHNRRWDSDFLTLRSVIERQQLGELTHYEAHFDRYRPSLKGYWKETAMPGAGNLYDLGAHLVDQAIVLFGVPDTVDAQVEIQRTGAENDDFFCLQLHYAQNPALQVILTASMLVQERGPKFLVKGTSGSFSKYGEDQQEQALRDGRTPLTQGNDWGAEPETAWGIVESTDGSQTTVPSNNGSYQVFYENLADAIQHNAPLLVDPSTVIAQIQILENAKQQLKKNILV